MSQVLKKDFTAIFEVKQISPQENAANMLLSH